MRKVIAILFFLIAALLVITGVAYSYAKNHKKAPQVSSFEECTKAGYPVMESYPRQCSTPDGHFFVETFIPEK
jgi:hypothetical protein